MRTALCVARGAWRVFFLLLVCRLQALEIRESENFRFYLEPRDLILEGGAKEALENCRAQADALFGLELKDKTPVYVYPGIQTFSKNGQLEEELIRRGNIIGLAKFNRVMILTPEALAFGYAWQEALCHEFLHHWLKNAVSEVLPLWFQEGFARRWETIWRGKTDFELALGDKEDLLLAAREKRLITFARMEPSLVYLKDSKEIGLAFAEASMALENLKPKLADFLKELQEENDFRKAFKKIYGQEFEQFEKELFASWLNLVSSTESLKVSGALRSGAVFGKEEELEKISLGPTISQLILLGDKMRARGKMSGAKNLYAKALEQEPKNPYVLSRLARSALALGQTNEALVKAQELVGANPHWPPGWELLGSIHERLGHLSEAVDAYDHYLQYNPFYFDLREKRDYLRNKISEKNKGNPK